MAGGWTVISFELTAPGFGADARVTRFDIDEALSELYELTLEVVCTDGDIDLGSLVGEEASLALQYAAGTRHILESEARFSMRRVHGTSTASCGAHGCTRSGTPCFAMTW